MTKSLLLLAAAGMLVAAPATINIPAVSKPPAIDGKLDDAAWRDASPLPLGPAAGEARIATCGEFLCLSARIPEGNRDPCLRVVRQHEKQQEQP